MEIITIIEYRDYRDGKLKELWFDETIYYIQRAISGMKEEGHTEFEIVKNPKNYKIEL